MDTDSPVSFITSSNYHKIFGLALDTLEPVERKFNMSENADEHFGKNKCLF